MKKLFFLFYFFGCINIYSQSYDAIKNLVSDDFVIFDYSYYEFDHNHYLDTAKVLKSFIGTKKFQKDSVTYKNEDSLIINYHFTVVQKGISVRRNFHDTLSNQLVESKFYVIITEYENDTTGANNRISGWIFRDSLLTSVSDKFDPIKMYPYKNYFRFYFPENDSLLNLRSDTLIIHYRPSLTNYNDSYYSEDIYIKKNKGIQKVKKIYGYLGTGFEENYTLASTDIIDKIIKKNKNASNNFSFSQNYPNPFNPTTTINYTLPYIGNANFASAKNVTLKVFDVLGREVATLVNQVQKSGNYKVNFDGSNLSSGIYFYQLKYGNYNKINKMILLK